MEKEVVVSFKLGDGIGENEVLSYVQDCLELQYAGVQRSSPRGFQVFTELSAKEREKQEIAKFAEQIETVAKGIGDDELPLQYRYCSEQMKQDYKRKMAAEQVCLGEGL